MAKLIQSHRDIGKLLLGRCPARRDLFKLAQRLFDPVGDLANLSRGVLLHSFEDGCESFGEDLVDDAADLVADFLPEGRGALRRGDFGEEKLRQLQLQLCNIVR